MLDGIGNAGVSQLPVPTLGAAGQAGALEAVMGLACTVFVGGLAAGNQLLALCFR